MRFRRWQRDYDEQSADGVVFTAFAAVAFVDRRGRNCGPNGLGSVLLDPGAERGFPFSARRSARACAGGMGNSVALSSSDLARRAFYPYAVFFQTVPIISIAPLLVIWFGFGRPTVVASAAIVSVFPIIASTLLGLKSTEPALVDLFKLYSATGRQTLWMLKIPFALPQIFSGLRIASGLAVVGAIVGEFIGGGGLGSVVDSARTQQRIDRVFAAVLISSLLGIVLVGAVNVVSSLSLGSWHTSERKSS